jgi:hypothetical protein
MIKNSVTYKIEPQSPNIFPHIRYHTASKEHKVKIKVKKHFLRKHNSIDKNIAFKIQRNNVESFFLKRQKWDIYIYAQVMVHKSCLCTVHKYPKLLSAPLDF